MLNLIKELVIQYKEHQKSQVKEIPRIEFEYSTLEADTKYPEFEVHVIKGQQVGNSYTSVAFIYSHTLVRTAEILANFLYFSLKAFLSLNQDDR